MVLEQAYIVEYVVQHHMCESCSRVQTNPDQWVATVQLRQNVSHTRTFYLEQLIFKLDAAVKAIIRVKQMDLGMDFFFVNRTHAVKFVEFVQKVAPIMTPRDNQLVSHDSKRNDYRYNEDLICLLPKVSVSLGNLGSHVICSKISKSIALLDPLTLRHCLFDAEQYWRCRLHQFCCVSNLWNMQYWMLNLFHLR